MQDPLITCKNCSESFLCRYREDTNGLPEQVDTVECPFCTTSIRVEYPADQRPDRSEFMHSGEIITCRTPYAYEWWRHNREMFARLRYRPRRTRHEHT